MTNSGVLENIHLIIQVTKLLYNTISKIMFESF
jgi:hypothetical protein